MFRALRATEFRVFLGCTMAFGIGLWIYRFGLGWSIVQLAVADGSATLAPLYLGLVGLATALPGIGLSLIAGAVVDHYDLRRILVICQVLGVAVCLALAWIAAAGLLTLWAILLIVACEAAVVTFEDTAKNTLLMRIVPRDAVGSAIGLDSVRFNLAQATGPAIGGVLIVAGGLPWIMLAYALGYAALTGVTLFATSRTAPLTTHRPPLLASIAEGLRYVRDDATLRWVIVLGLALAVFTRPYVSLIPAFAENALGVGPVGLATLMSAVGVGGLAGAVLLAAIGGGPRPGIAFMRGIALSGIALVMLSLQRDLIGAIVVALGLGTAVLVANGMQNTILQTASASYMVGRVVSVAVMIFFGALPLGQLALGALGSVVGIEVSLFLGGAVTVGAALYALARARPIRSLTTFVGGTDAPEARPG